MLTARAIDMLGSPLSKYGGYRIVVTCGNQERYCRHCSSRLSPCHHRGEIKVSDLYDKLGDIQIQEVIRRLKCPVCGAHPAHVAMRHHIACEWLVGGEEGDSSADS